MVAIGDLKLVLMAMFSIKGNKRMGQVIVRAEDRKDNEADV